MDEFLERFESTTSEHYDRKDALKALRGEALPKHRDCPLMMLCIIRGILHSPSFAEGEAAVLYGLPQYPEYTRALNARAIMSGRVPDMNRPAEMPYCIWYPDVASEDAYRQLVSRYPQMRYNVARACAVAGYTKLYLELNVLPEVNVAEEARDAGSDAILTHIMAQPFRYKVMDDYYRTLSLDSPQPAHINNDTCVLSILKQQKQAFRNPPAADDDWGIMTGETGFEEMIYNITEDQGVEQSVPDDQPEGELMLDLLTAPLPADLPSGNKDLLILTAAYYGNIDRYTRLRRPKRLKAELFCIVHGIYHNSLFALWWSHQEEPPRNGPFSYVHEWAQIQMAITARHIMNNDLSRVLAHREHLPYLIWHPDTAQPATYRALAHRVPEMREACVRAAIFTGDTALFDELLVLPDIVPSPFLMKQAEANANPHFRTSLQARADELGVNLNPSADPSKWNMFHDYWKRECVRTVRTDWLASSPRSWLVMGEFLDGFAVYNGTRAETEMLEFFLMAPESWRSKERDVEVDYEKWPESWQDV